MEINYKNFKTKLNSDLESWLNKKEKDFDEKFEQELTQKIITQIKKIALADAKRIRPYVAFLMYNEEKDENDICWYPFLAIELFHLFGLIHDDIMDCDRLRRGEKTIQEFIKDENIFNKKRGNHKGNSLAILAGDLVYSWVNELFYQTESYSIERINSAKKHFFDMSEEVMVGQIMDMDNRHDKELDFLFKKMSLKTASYTFVRPMQFGLALGGGTQYKHNFCEKWGQKMGLIFQIQDNLIDFESSETMKDDFSDIKEGNINIFTYFVKKNESEKYKEVLEPNLGKNELSYEDKVKIRTLFNSSGAVKYAKNQINDYLDDAKNLLKEVELKPNTKDNLNKLIALLENRKK